MTATKGWVVVTGVCIGAMVPLAYLWWSKSDKKPVDSDPSHAGSVSGSKDASWLLRTKNKLYSEYVTMTEEEKEAVIAKRKAQRDRVDQGFQGGQRIVVDLGFDDDLHSEKESSSLVKQLVCAYGQLRRAPCVPQLHLTSCVGRVRDQLMKRGAEKWKVHFHEESVEEVFQAEVVAGRSGPGNQRHSGDEGDMETAEHGDGVAGELVYLTPDATEVLWSVEPNHVYVVGGIVDRCVAKNESLSKAGRLRVRTVRLPVQETFPHCATHVMNVDAVVYTLMAVMAGASWADALEKTLPERKKVTPQGEGSRRARRQAGAAAAAAGEKRGGGAGRGESSGGHSKSKSDRSRPGGWWRGEGGEGKDGKMGAGAGATGGVGDLEQVLDDAVMSDMFGCDEDE